MVSLTSVLILDNVSVKLKDDGDVCITMTPSLSPFSLLPPRHHRRSSFVRSRHFDPLGALGRLAADDTKCARRARVWRNKRWADFRVCCWARSLKRKLAGRTKNKKKKAHDCVYSPVYSSVAIFATANQVIFTLPCQRVESNDDRTPALTPGLVTAQSGQEGYKSVNRWQLNINLGHYNEVH